MSAPRKLSSYGFEMERLAIRMGRLPEYIEVKKLLTYEEVIEIRTTFYGYRRALDREIHDNRKYIPGERLAELQLYSECTHSYKANAIPPIGNKANKLNGKGYSLIFIHTDKTTAMQALNEGLKDFYAENPSTLDKILTPNLADKGAPNPSATPQKEAMDQAAEVYKKWMPDETPLSNPDEPPPRDPSPPLTGPIPYPKKDPQEREDEN